MKKISSSSGEFMAFPVNGDLTVEFDAEGTVVTDEVAEIIKERWGDQVIVADASDEDIPVSPKPPVDAPPLTEPEGGNSEKASEPINAPSA